MHGVWLSGSQLNGNTTKINVSYICNQGLNSCNDSFQHNKKNATKTSRSLSCPSPTLNVCVPLSINYGVIISETRV